MCDLSLWSYSFKEIPETIKHERTILVGLPVTFLVAGKFAMERVGRISPNSETKSLWLVLSFLCSVGFVSWSFALHLHLSKCYANSQLMFSSHEPCLWKGRGRSPWIRSCASRSAPLFFPNLPIMTKKMSTRSRCVLPRKVSRHSQSLSAGVVARQEIFTF